MCLSADIYISSQSAAKGKYSVDYCDSSKMNINRKEDNCIVTLAKLVRMEYIDVIKFYEREDANISVKLIEVEVFNSSITIFGNALDEFIAPRPWWVIKHEQTNSFSDDINYFKLTMLRFSIGIEQQLRLHSAIQFPPKDICEITPLALGRLVDNGWASMMYLYGNARVGDNSFRSIFYPYVTITNSASDVTIFADNDFCPGVINKWLCSFLLTTNCSLPEQITMCKCRDNADCQCLPRGRQYFYSNASTSGIRVANINNVDQDPHLIKYVNKVKTMYPASKDTIRPGIFYNAHNKTILKSVYTSQILSTYAMLWRHNAVLRSKIAFKLNTLQHSYSKTLRGQCVAIHIRRGDRVAGIEVEETRNFCRRHKMIKGNWSDCQDEKGLKVSCQKISDYGCFGVNPFGSLRLQDYLDRAWGLLPTRNVFIMTDDREWLIRERNLVSTAWNIFNITGPKKRFSAENGLHYFSSIAMAQKCHAFVGNFISGVSKMVYDMMCIQHADSIGKCPPAVDIGQL